MHWGWDLNEYCSRQCHEGHSLLLEKKWTTMYCMFLPEESGDGNEQ